MKQIENILNITGIRGRGSWEIGEGLFVLSNDRKVFVANFFPIVTDVLDLDDEKVIYITLIFASGNESEIQVEVKKLRHIDWFEVCAQCSVEDDSKDAQAFLKRLVQVQVAEYEGRMTKVTYYRQIGWNRDVYGNPVYVFGDCYLGGDINAQISPTLSKYKLQYKFNEQHEMLSLFVDLLAGVPVEGTIALGYFFSGLLKQLYKEAGVPVNFILYILGKQQYRKTTLSKLTNSLYCRSEDMDFCVRTVEKITNAVAEKEISMFKDTTLILDDVSLTTDLKYQKKQESIVEKVTRLIGNNSRKTSNWGCEIKEYFPNANVIITGEYLPKLPESTLTRMLIMELQNPSDAKWLTKLGIEPLMLSTVAYSFLTWIQKNYNIIVKLIRDNFMSYRDSRVDKQPFQERLQEHGFVIQCTFYLLNRFLIEMRYSSIDTNIIFSEITQQIKCVLQEQVKIIEKYRCDLVGKDYCKAFVTLYVNGSFRIADNKKSYCQKKDDMFRGKNDCVCITSVKLCAIMREFYEDNDISIQAVTKQFRNNGFLEIDKSKKSSKKVGKERYLHIKESMIEEYCDYLT